MIDDDDDMRIPEFLRRTQPKETDMARGRPKGSKNKPKSEAQAPEAGNGIGHNKPPADLTEDQRQALAIQHKKSYQAALAVKKEADAKFKHACKLAKAELGDDAVDLIKDMILLESEEGEATLRARAERARRAAIYMAAPLGAQFDFFEDRMPATERAFAEGKRDAMAGEPLTNPYDPSVPQNNSYAEGWHAGQKALVEAQKMRDAEVSDAPAVSPEEAAALEEIERVGIGGAVAGAIAH